MNAYSACRARLRASLLLMAIACAAGCSAAPMITGKIMDGETGMPLEGAYVLAEYTEGSGGEWFGGHSATWCVRTRGMYTPADGSFHFSNDGRSVPDLHAIKPGYTSYRGANYRNSDSNGVYQIKYLQRQNPAHPQLNYGFPEGCMRPKFREDMTAAIEFARLELAEKIKYDPGQSSRWEADFNDDVSEMNLLPEKSKSTR